MKFVVSSIFNQTKFGFASCATLVLAAFFAVAPISSRGQGSSQTASSRADLGDVAVMDLPPGFQFLNAAEARKALDRSGNRAPKGLLGILMTQSGGWWAVVQFSEIGYVKALDSADLDPVGILQAIEKENEHRGRASILSADWKKQPVYDEAGHSLSWALRVQTEGANVINNNVILFGRRGALQLTAVQKFDPAAGLPPLGQLLTFITFKPGQRYEDFAAGDQVSTMTPVELVASGQQANATKEAATPSYVLWIVGGVGAGAVFLVALTIFLKLRRIRQINRALAVSANGEVAHTNGHSRPHFARNGGLNGSAHARPGARGRNMARRKMAFNYSKFYTDFVMMSHVNSPNEAAQANANGRTDAQGLPLDQVPMDPSTASLNVELITTLRSLVEEQKRLIQQQTKFIDEKSEFIKLQNEFQERQSALIETQYSLKLE